MVITIVQKKVLMRRADCIRSRSGVSNLDRQLLENLESDNQSLYEQPRHAKECDGDRRTASHRLSASRRLCARLVDCCLFLRSPMSACAATYLQQISRVKEGSSLIESTGFMKLLELSRKGLF
jgi:hypothetical protein